MFCERISCLISYNTALFYCRYIAVHQTYTERLLKTCVREVGNRHTISDEESDEEPEVKSAAREECICVDMDFAENYEIVHKIEIQSEHWKHQQVTLYIVITHFKSNGQWKSEAHIFVSSDGSHDTYFVQRAMAGFCLL